MSTWIREPGNEALQARAEELRQQRPTKRPDRDTLSALIEKHGGNTVKIAAALSTKDSKVRQEEVSRWIREPGNEALQARAEELRQQRRNPQWQQLIVIVGLLGLIAWAFATKYGETAFAVPFSIIRLLESWIIMFHQNPTWKRIESAA